MNKVLILGLLLIASVVINGYFIFSQKKSDVLGTETKMQKEYPLLSKRIYLEDANDVLINFLPLRQELRQVVEPYGDGFGFYFEYLPTGTSIGVNEKVDFESASLFKIPIIMAYYRGIERKNLSEDITETIQEKDIDKEFGTLWKKGVGSKITLEEAVKLAITKSDNTAMHVIERHVDSEDIEAVYEGLDINLNKSENGHVFVSVKGFTSVLKSLYMTALLSKDHSQHVLDLMTQVEFRDALIAGVPSDVSVSHKIGVFDDQLYMDCGIVYVPNRPYAVCMVSASDAQTAQTRMKDLSKRVYGFVTSQEKEHALSRE